MGFNARLAPYTLCRDIEFQATSNDAAATQHCSLFKFPFAGQLVGAYANVRKIQPAATAATAAVEATTNTGIDQVCIWKHATDDTTATYATALRAAARTGDADSSTGGGINWRLPTTAAGTNTTEAGLYTLTNKTATRRKFNAGDQAILGFSSYGATNSHRQWSVHVQMDYVIGHEA